MADEDPTLETPEDFAKIVARMSPPRLGDYEILEKIARGGAGVVYKARQISLNRTVALKLILDSQLASDEQVRRFYAEAEAAAALQHPNIVAVHEVGQHDGQHYFSMDFVDGQPLSQLVREHPLPVSRAVRYVKTIAEAVHFAHQNGTLHRDLKPANILISSQDTVRVTDFGLAKRFEHGSDLTPSGIVLGTPSYMPPEQAAPSHGPLGPPSDVYALGGILYELLTARPPFQAETPLDTLRRMLVEDPVSPRLLNPKVPPDLETICLKCLEKESSRRYASAQELADDLDRFQRHEPILARRAGRFERTWRWCRRKPALATLAGALVISLQIGIAGIVWQWRHALHERGQAQEASQRLGKALKQALSGQREMLRTTHDPRTRGTLQAGLQEPLRLCEEFLREKHNAPELVHLRANLLREIGRIHDGLGNHALAETNLRLAAGAFSELQQQFPRELSYQQARADSLNWLGEALRKQSRIAQAEDAYQAAIALQQSLVGLDYGAAALRAELARSQYNLGILWTDAGRANEAEKSFDAALDLLRPLVKSYPDDRDYRQGLARAFLNRGRLRRIQKRLSEAERDYQQSIDAYRPLSSARKSDAEFRSELATAELDLANLLYGSAEKLHAKAASLTAAREHYDLAIQTLRGLVNEFPGVPDYQKELANCLNGLGSVHYAESRISEAEAAFNEAERHLAGLVKQFPGEAEYHRKLGVALSNQARVVRKRDLSGTAAKDPQGERETLESLARLYSAAVEHQEIALKPNPRDPNGRKFLFQNRDQLIRCWLELKDHAHAVDQARLLPNDSSDPSDWFGAANLLAKCIPLARADTSLDATHQERLVEEYALQTVALLRAAIDHGLKKPSKRLAWKVFKPLADRDDFRALLADPSSDGKQP